MYVKEICILFVGGFFIIIVSTFFLQSGREIKFGRRKLKGKVYNFFQQ